MLHLFKVIDNYSSRLVNSSGSCIDQLRTVLGNQFDLPLNV